MKKFFFRLAFFLIPVVILLVAIEVHLRTSENAFAIKAKYLKEHKSEIEVLIFGSSHSQNGLNPAYFSENTCNLAYAAQDIKIDSALFFSNVRQLKKLRTVVYEIDYHRMDTENPKDYFKYPWYYVFYGIEIEKLGWINKISLYSSDTKFFNGILMGAISGKEKPQHFNKFGYVDKNFNSRFREMNHDSINICATAEARLNGRHNEISAIFFRNNKKRILYLIDYCQKNHIQIYFVSSPLYETYRKLMLPKKVKKVHDFIKELQEKEGIKYFDFSADNHFNLKDFADDDHLNPTGAKKYSKIIDSIIRQ